MELMTMPPGGRPLSAMPPPPAAASAIQQSDIVLSPVARSLRAFEQRMAQTMEALPRESLLASRVQYKLYERRQRRRGIEEEILEAYRRYNGEYSGDIRARLGSQPNRSRLWVDLTRMKTDAAHAGVMDVLRGPSGDKPWGLKAVELPEDLELPEIMVAKGITLDDVREEQKKRVRAMEQEICGQLDVADFDEKMDGAVLDCVIAGTGVVFGPYTVPDKQDTWEMALEANLQNAVTNRKKRNGYRPMLRQVPVLNYFPDMETPDSSNADPIEVMPLTRREFMRLAEQPGINPAAVLAVLREQPQGNYVPSTEIVEIRRISEDNRPSESSMYEVILYYGEVTGQELRDAGGDVLDEDLTLSVTAELWVCKNYVLRARKHEGANPYHAFKYRKRGTQSPFGRGMPMLCKSSQDAINGAARMIMDNAAIASGPIIELNTMLLKLQPGSDPGNIHGWKVYWSSHDGHSGKRAVFIHNFPAYTEVFIQIINIFRQLLDEESGQPSLTSGMQGRGTTRTATGMSILNTNANKMRNHTLRYIDDGLLEPLIEGFFEWNMLYSTNRGLFAPAKVSAKGTQNLMSREVESQRLLTLFQIFMGHPAFRDNQAMKAIFRTMGLPVDDLVLSEEETQRMAAAAAAAGPPEGGRPLATAAEQVARGPVPEMAGAPPVGPESGAIPSFGGVAG